MALEFSDFGLSPEEQVATRKKALESFANVAGPAQREQQARERGQLLTDAYVAASKAQQEGKPQDVTGVLAQAQAKAAEMFPSQAAKADTLAMQGAKYREDIISSKQDAALTQYEAKTAEMKQAAARQLANQVFEYGISADKLALAQDAYLADEGLKRLYQDYEAGRKSKDEIANLSNALMLDAKKMEYAFMQEKATLDGQLKELLANNDIAAAKALAKKVLAKQKEIMEKAAKAAQTAGIISGMFKLGAVAVATYYGGPAGGAAASAATSN
jgi:hypothetical protein